MKIHSTQDLIERRPPIIDLFLNEEYDLYLPYLRFLPIGADSNTPPEEAEDSICPFLFPISDVFSFHKLQLPQNVRKDSMGCMLMDCKPSICRLSPVGQARGMITGKLSYEYIEPAKNCPGCAADVEIPLPQYINALLSSSDEEERALFHKMLMAHNTRRQEGYDQKKFKSVLLEFYNIDRLLSINDYAPKQRPSCGQLLKILIAAAQGDVSLYDKFIQSLNKNNHETMKINRNDREYTSSLKKEFIKCFKTLNSHRDIIDYKEVFTTDSDHRYLISAKVGSSIRKHLEIKENAFTDYSTSFDSYLPLFIYRDESLILAKFRRKINSVFVEYYSHKANCNFSRKELISHHSTKYKELYNYSNVFSIIDSLLTKVSIIDSSEVDQHRRLVSTELEEEYPMILYYIEQAVVLAYQKLTDLTDRIVANALKELISQKEDRIYRVDYFGAKEEMMHRELLVQINSVGLESKCPKRILVNALKQVLGSVKGFIKQGTADDAYLKFILDYFQ